MNLSGSACLMLLVCLGVMLLAGGSAAGSGTALEPYHSGTDYTFTGNYSDGQVIINSSGGYYLTENLTASSSEYGIQIGGRDISLDGNGMTLTGSGGNGIDIPSGIDNAMVTNFSRISGFSRGVSIDGNYSKLNNNTICENELTGIWVTIGNYEEIYNNLICDNAFNSSGRGGIFLVAGGSAHATVSGNIVCDNQKIGIYTGGNYARITGNTVYNNTQIGISAGGSNAGGTDPGVRGKGYYVRIIGNTVYGNGLKSAYPTQTGGIYNFNPSARIEDNLVYDNNVTGIELYNSLNCSVINNTIINSSHGIQLAYGIRQNATIVRNTIRNNSDSGIYFYDRYSDSPYSLGNGTVYDNYLANSRNVHGDGTIPNFTWTNPFGPQPGTNVMGGSSIAGNYWSNPSGTGWSDLQDADISGYSTIPYEVVSGSGAWDTAPLIRRSLVVHAASDDYTITYPHGDHSYPVHTDAAYLTQARPGSNLVNVSVDGSFKGPVGNWTFTAITANHTITSIGQPTPGQVQALFSMNMTYGPAPLTVQFMNQSLGDPTSFYWGFGDGENATVRDPVHRYDLPGTYSVTLKASNEKTGGIAVLRDAVTVTDGVVPVPTPAPAPGVISAAFSADQTTGPAPLQISFTDHSTGNPVSWSWDLGDGNMSASQNVTHRYSSKGNYSVSLSAGNSISTGSLEKNGYITVY